MTAEEKRDGNLVVVNVDKSIAASDVDSYKKRFKDFIADGVKNITLDCGLVEIIDSIGIGFLVATHNSLKEVGGKLELINTSEDLFKLLSTMRLDKHFAVART